jgi:hypothetical protein
LAPWSLTGSPTGGRISTCDKSYSASLNLNKGYAQSPYGPVFIARSGGISGTLTLNGGRGQYFANRARRPGYGQCRQWPV